MLRIMRPGKIASTPYMSFGNAAMSGVRCAAASSSAASARCTTRKSVHQYPKLCTNPRPNTIANHCTAIGLSVEPVLAQAWKKSARPMDSCRPDRPPTSIRPKMTSGSSPSVIRKNCNTSL